MAARAQESSSESAAGETAQILNSIRRIVQALRISARDAERKLGISGAQLFVLQCLDPKKGLSVNEIASRTFTHQSSVSVVISRLVERGLVLRLPSKSDVRRREVRLTSKGRTLLKNCPPTAQELLISSILMLPPVHRRQLNDRLTTLVENTFPDSTPPNLFFEENKEGEK